MHCLRNNLIYYFIVDRAWTLTQWTSCSFVCDYATRSRNRQCMPSTTAQYGGERDCDGLASETEVCSQPNCDRKYQYRYEADLILFLY